MDNAPPGTRAFHSRLLRKHGFIRMVFAVMSVAALLSALFLCVVYRWTAANPLVYYFAMRPAWFWFSALVPFLAIGARAFRKAAFLVIAVLWVSLFCLTADIRPLLRLGPGKAPSHTGDNITLRLVTWNILADSKTTPAALQELAVFDPDVVLLQECSFGSILADAQRASEYFAAFNMVKQGDTAVLSRFTLTPLDQPVLSANLGQVVSLELPSGKSICLLNVHLPPPGLVTEIWPRGGFAALSSSAQAQQRTLNMLRALATSPLASGPTIIAGDFNIPGTYRPLENALPGFVEVFTSAGRGWGGTVPATVPMSRIDLIFVSLHFMPLDAHVPSTASSDHRPVVADVLLASPAQ